MRGGLAFPEIMPRAGLMFEGGRSARRDRGIGHGSCPADTLVGEARFAYENNWREDIVITEYLMSRKAARAKAINTSFRHWEIYHELS
jgi:hypothetical protein